VTTGADKHTIRFSYAGAPTLQAFARSDQRIRGVMGPFGSGKSSACVVELIRRGRAQLPPDPSQVPGGADGRSNIARSRWAVIRNTYEELRKTTYKTIFRWLPPHQFGKWKESKREYLVTAFRGYEIEIVFVALDRPDQIADLKSFEVTGAWINEASEVPWELIRVLNGRIGRYPEMDYGGPTWRGIWMDTNPPAATSEWYNYFERLKPDNAAIWKQPGGMSPGAENLANLERDYYRELAKGLTPEECKIYVDGEYGFITSGLRVYPGYADAAHNRGQLEVVAPKLWRGWDFGMTPAVVFCQERAGGRLEVIREICSDRSDVAAFAETVLAFSDREFGEGREWEDVGDPSGNYPGEERGDSCFEILHGKGIGIYEGVQAPTTRVEAVKYGLRTMFNGVPLLTIDERAERVREGFLGGYQHRKMASRGSFGESRYEEKPLKNKYSHPHDALQYVAVEIWGGCLAGVDEKAAAMQTHTLVQHDPLGPLELPAPRARIIDGIPVQYTEDTDEGLQHYVEGW